jgi:hypothetical protein
MIAPEAKSGRKAKSVWMRRSEFEGVQMVHEKDLSFSSVESSNHGNLIKASLYI